MLASLSACTKVQRRNVETNVGARSLEDGPFPHPLTPLIQRQASLTPHAYY